MKPLVRLQQTRNGKRRVHCIMSARNWAVQEASNLYLNLAEIDSETFLRGVKGVRVTQ